MSVYSDKVLADGATAYWRLGETSGSTVASEVGSYPGTISGGVTLGQPGALADGNRAMAFDGSTGKITPIANLSLTAAMSCEAWVSTNVTSGLVIIFSNRSDGKVLIGLLDGHPEFRIETVAYMSGSTQCADGKWHHFVATNDGTRCRFYIDGVLDPVSPVGGHPAEPSVATSSLAFDLAGYYWNGYLDDVAIYPTALTAPQIAAHYDARLALQTPTGLPPLIAVTLPPGGTPGTQWRPLTPSDFADSPFSAIWVGGAGTVAAVDAGGRVVEFAGVQAGTRLTIAGRRINLTNTTATNMLALQR